MRVLIEIMVKLRHGLLLLPLIVFLVDRLSADFTFSISQALSLSKPDWLIVFWLFYALLVLASFLASDFLGVYGVFLVLSLGALALWLMLLKNFFFFLTAGAEAHVCLGTFLWLTPTLRIDISLGLDFLAYNFLLLVITIAVFVNFFTFAYFRYEPCVSSLLRLLNAFVLSMSLLILAGNLVIFFLG